MPITDDLIAWWELGEASGTRSDSHGANDLTDNNTVGSAAGVVGDAADLGNTGSNGGFTNESLSIADNADLSIAGHVGFTVCGWIRASNLAGLHTVLGKWNYNAAQKEYIVLANGTTLYLWASPDGSSETQLAGATLTLNTWHFFAAWHDPVADKIYLQVDGGTIAETAYSGGIFDGTSTFQIGGIAGVQEYGWGGQIDQVGFWKRVLTSDERAALYNAGDGVAYADIAGGGPSPQTGTATTPAAVLTGVAATALPGAVAGTATTPAVTARGVSATGLPGAVAAQAGAGAFALTGVDATGAIGTVPLTGTATTPALSATGVAATGLAGPVAGVGATGTLGLSGVPAEGIPGATTRQATTPSLSSIGVDATGALGGLDGQAGTPVVRIVGVDASGLVGAVARQAGTGTLAYTGVAATSPQQARIARISFGLRTRSTAFSLRTRGITFNLRPA